MAPYDSRECKSSVLDHRGDRLISQSSPSGTRKEFYAKVVGNDARVRAGWSKLVFTGKVSPPKELDAAQVVTTVAADPNAIGYVDKTFVNMTVKVIYTVK